MRSDRTPLSRRRLLQALSLGPAGALAQAPLPTLRLATLEWPPYTGATLLGQGASSVVLRTALRQVGAGLELGFMPWARALVEGGAGGTRDGYFPAYRSEERDRQGLRSLRIGASRVGFAYRRAQPVAWRSLDELAALPIGVVRGFVNTADFDRRVREGLLRTDPAVSDEENLRKLAAGRVQLAVVDEAVFHALCAGPLAAQAPHLAFDASQLLEEKPLYVYLRDAVWRDRLDRGLAKLDVDAVFRRALINA
jgi:polar amino acid transport system substrate-binding protein